MTTILTTNFENQSNPNQKVFLPDLENGACPPWSLSPERVSKKWVLIDSYALKKAELHNQKICGKSGEINFWINELINFDVCKDEEL